jgi:hypothetical protein
MGMSHISLEHIDHTGALREMADGVGAVDGDGTRRALLRKAGMTGAGFVAGGVLFNGLLSPAEAAGINWKRRRSNGNDVKIANYALTLEYLEAAFYKAAITSGVVTDPDAVALAKTIYGHEAAHVKALKQALGKAAVKSPKFDFSSLLKDQKTVLTSAAAVEPVGVSAYAGAGPYIKQLPILKAALAIHSVEANHAAWIATLLQVKGISTEFKPAPNAFNPARSEKAVLKIVTSLDVIK